MESAEKFRSGMERTETPFTIRIRRDPTFTVRTADRIVWGSVVIDVESVIDIGGRRHTIEIVGVARSGTDVGTVV